MKYKLMHKAVLPILFARNDGIYVLDEKWDNLIILDGCRFDTFKQLYSVEGLKGRLEYRVTRGTETSSFLQENFGKVEKIRDLVYVTANPVVTKLFKDKFYETVSVWKEAWSAKDETVLPEQMYEHTLAAIQKYQDKRLIIHFLQPHRPFIGYPAKNWLADKKPDRRFLRWYLTQTWGTISEEGRSLLTVMNRETLMRFYKRNLKLVLPYVRRLLDVLPGTTVVTSDHGEAFGEFIYPVIPVGVYGHPGHTRIHVLTKVPWLVFESPAKKVVREGVETISTEQLPEDEEELISKRLSALGYS